MDRRASIGRIQKSPFSTNFSTPKQQHLPVRPECNHGHMSLARLVLGLLVSPLWALQVMPRATVMRAPAPRMLSPKDELVAAIERYEKAITSDLGRRTVLASLGSLAVGSAVGKIAPNMIITSPPPTKSAPATKGSAKPATPVVTVPEVVPPAPGATKKEAQPVVAKQKEADSVIAKKEPEPAKKEPEPAVVKKEPEPVVVKKEPEPLAVKKEPEPVVVKKEPEPVVVKKEPEPVLVKKAPEPVVVKK